MIYHLRPAVIYCMASLILRIISIPAPFLDSPLRLFLWNSFDTRYQGRFSNEPCTGSRMTAPPGPKRTSGPAFLTPSPALAGHCSGLPALEPIRAPSCPVD